MKKLFAILSFIGCLSLNAQTPFLFVNKHAIMFEANSNAGDMYFPAEMSNNATGRFNIISSVDWRIDCSKTWLTVTVQMYYSKGKQGYVYNPHSGSAPDIGAFEFMESYATGRDTAFVLLVAEPNTGVSRMATVVITGLNVTTQVIMVTQKGVSEPPPSEPSIEPNSIMIAKN